MRTLQGMVEGTVLGYLLTHPSSGLESLYCLS